MTNAELQPAVEKDVVRILDSMQGWMNRELWEMTVTEKKVIKLRFCPTRKGWLMMEAMWAMLMNRIPPSS
jgi:hypothetical protein